VQGRSKRINMVSKKVIGEGSYFWITHRLRYFYGNMKWQLDLHVGLLI